MAGDHVNDAGVAGVLRQILNYQLNRMTLRQVFMSMVLVWLVCFILTVAGAFPSDPDSIGFGARTDTKHQVLSQASWFRFPYPGEFYSNGVRQI